MTSWGALGGVRAFAQEDDLGLLFFNGLGGGERKKERREVEKERKKERKKKRERERNGEKRKRSARPVIDGFFSSMFIASASSSVACFSEKTKAPRSPSSRAAS